eukprot:3788823-Rhodomonas_salina.2
MQTKLLEGIPSNMNLVNLTLLITGPLCPRTPLSTPPLVHSCASRVAAHSCHHRCLLVCLNVRADCGMPSTDGPYGPTP